MVKADVNGTLLNLISAGGPAAATGRVPARTASPCGGDGVACVVVLPFPSLPNPIASVTTCGNFSPGNSLSPSYRNV